MHENTSSIPFLEVIKLDLLILYPTDISPISLNIAGDISHNPSFFIKK